jgi:tetratricopeptide (TPR) repeat protein
VKPVILRSYRSQQRAGQSSPNQLCRSLGLVSLSFLLWAPALAQSTAPPASLPPEAAEAINKGILAAKQEDYLLAIQHFQQARSIAPDDPVIFFNLGLAESKIPGRELRAMAWFGAYCAADPNSTKVPLVKDQIDRLKVTNESNLSRLIAMVQDAAISSNDDRRFGDIADLWAESGDFAAALKTSSLIKDENERGFAQAEIAKVQTEAQAAAGNITSAQNTAALIHYPSSQTLALEAIAAAQGKKGDLAGARITLVSAGTEAELIQNPEQESIYEETIAVAQVTAGDIPGARITFASALKNADLVGEPYSSSMKQELVKAQASAGDVAGAQKSADGIPDKDVKSSALTAIAQMQAETRSTTPVVIQSGVTDWLSRLDDDQDADVYDGNYRCPLKTDIFLKLEGELTQEQPVDRKGPYDQIDRLTIIARKIIIARNIIYEMLKQEAAK